MLSHPAPIKARARLVQGQSPAGLGRRISEGSLSRASERLTESSRASLQYSKVGHFQRAEQAERKAASKLRGSDDACPFASAFLVSYSRNSPTGCSDLIVKL